MNRAHWAQLPDGRVVPASDDPCVLDPCVLDPRELPTDEQRAFTHAEVAKFCVEVKPRPSAGAALHWLAVRRGNG